MKEHTLRPCERRPGKIDYDAELNESQREVVFAGDGPLLVIAGAGSGKTRTLTFRVARLLEMGRSPSSLLLLTFTNKAAREMLGRAAWLTGRPDYRFPFGGTFHHVGNLVLRRHAPLAGLRENYTILDREDSADLFQELSHRHRRSNPRFPRGEVLLTLFSFAVNTGTQPEQVIFRHRPDFVPILDDLLATFRAYQKRKQELNVVDFDDLLVFWNRLLLEHPDVLEAQRAAFREILVDEYQDTNRLQADIVERIAGPEGNLMVVGDDAQSIYSFRGASFQNIIEFRKRFPNCRMFQLDTNYRSTPEILRLASASISENLRQFPKNLRAVRAPGPMPALVQCRDEREQARYVVERIRSLREEGVPLSEIAVLYRAHHHAMELQMELQSAGVPFQVRSGLRFFEQAHIKDVSAFLKIAANDRDELSWKRVLRLTPRVGTKTASRIWDRIAASPSPLEGFAGAIDLVPQGAREMLRDLEALLRRLRSPAFFEQPGEAIRHVLEETYGSYLAMTYPNAPSRAEDVRRLADFAGKFSSTLEMLSELSLTATHPAEGPDPEARDGSVVLTTIHQAKGLEWTAVFVIWLVEGRFPIGMSAANEDEMEEERRLFYVACTRAKEHLCLCYPEAAQERGLSVRTRISRFVLELPEDSYTFARAGPIETPSNGRE